MSISNDKNSIPGFLLNAWYQTFSQQRYIAPAAWEDNADWQQPLLSTPLKKDSFEWNRRFFEYFIGWDQYDSMKIKVFKLVSLYYAFIIFKNVIKVVSEFPLKLVTNLFFDSFLGYLKSREQSRAIYTVQAVTGMLLGLPLYVAWLLVRTVTSPVKSYCMAREQSDVLAAASLLCTVIGWAGVATLLFPLLLILAAKVGIVAVATAGAAVALSAGSYAVYQKSGFFFQEKIIQQENDSNNSVHSEEEAESPIRKIYEKHLKGKRKQYNDHSNNSVHLDTCDDVSDNSVHLDTCDDVSDNSVHLDTCDDVSEQGSLSLSGG